MAKDAYFFSHDSNARTDPKIMSMLLDNKAEGYGLYWCIIEMLSEQSEYKLKLNKMTFNAIAMAMLCDSMAVENFVMRLLSDYELFKNDGEYFWSESLVRRMSKKEQNRLKRSQAGKKGADARWGNDSNEMANGWQTDGNAIATASQEMANDSKGKERKGKDIKESIESKESIALNQLNLNSNRKFFKKSQICNNCNFEYDSHGNECPIWVDKEIKDTCFNFKEKQSGSVNLDTSKLCEDCKESPGCYKQKLLNCRTCPTFKPKEGLSNE